MSKELFNYLTKLTDWSTSRIIFFIIGLVIIGSLEVSFILGLTHLVTKVSGNVDHEGALWLGIMFITLLIIKASAVIFYSYYIGKQVFGVFSSLYFRLLHKVTGLSLDEFSDHGQSYIKSKLGVDLTQVQINFIIPSLTAVAEIFVILLIVISLAIIYPIESLTLFGTLGVIAFIIQKTLANKSILAGNERQVSEEFRSGLNDFILENRSLCQSERVRKNIESQAKENIVGLSNSWRKQVFYGSLPRPLFEVAGYLAMGLALIPAFINSPSDSLAVGVSFGAAGLRLLPSITRVMLCLQHVSYNKKTVKSVLELLNASETERLIINNITNSDESSFLMFRKFNPIVNNTPLWDTDLDGRFEGQFLGLIGESGSGKTSLSRALLGAINYNGSVVVNIQSSEIDEKGVRFVEQHETLMPSTIRENLLLDADLEIINNDIIKSSLQKVGLYYLYEKLDELNIVQTLSGGERQRIVLLRGMFSNASVIIFDEITSALDNETSFSVLKFIKESNLSTMRIYLFITHSALIQDELNSVIKLTNR